MKKQNRIIGTGIITAIAASLCCITPVLALLAGTSGIASSFSWLEPLGPYLIGITILTIGFAWYQKLRPVRKDDCGCEITEKKKFIHTKTFLGLVTVFAILMMSFPYYSKIFYPKPAKEMVINGGAVHKIAEVKIKGMTCAACEEHVKHEVNKLPGIISSEVSYANRNAIITFDTLKTNIKAIELAVDKTGYKVTEIKLK
ncbi:MAG: mercuric transport protein MerTP [Ferruginibacter sp.]|nr:mercuric transport protein MerTP [Ferruginibacter sp.]